MRTTQAMCKHMAEEIDVKNREKLPKTEGPVCGQSLKTKFRLLCVALGTCGLFSLLLIQFFKVQILEGEKWTRAANLQHQIVLKEPARRGVFYSNTAIKKGHPEELASFVMDVPKFHLFVDPSAIPLHVRGPLATELSQKVKLQEKKISEQLEKKSRSRKLKMWLSLEEKTQVQTWWDSFWKGHKLPKNALYFIQDYKRSYPFGQMLGQILHTLREESDAQVKRRVPTGGLELVLDRYLKGKEGKKLLFRSPRHPLDSGAILAQPEHGANVYLTINHYIQAIAEEEIALAVQRANAKRGWAVMMHPKTGEIYALAQYPPFNPEGYSKQFKENPDEMQVKAINEPYEPGSTMKPLTLAICLKANIELKKQGKPPIFSPEEKVAVRSGRFPGRSKPISDIHPYDYLNMDLALQKSSNIYMARMVQRIIDHLGADWYRKCLVELGLGAKTGIELPGESLGILPTPGKKHPNGTLEWSTPTPFSMAFGHNILVSSLQMIKSYAILANGGFDVSPTLIRKIVKTDANDKQEILVDNTRSKEPLRILDQEIVDRVIRSMKAVTKPGGTASKGDIPGFTEVGKTSTTEKIVRGTYSKKDHIATFIGFAPAHHAEFVLLIAIDDPEFKYIPGVGKNQMGGNCAAPAFRDIARRTLEYLGSEPDDPQNTSWVKEVKQLKELLNQWNH